MKIDVFERELEMNEYMNRFVNTEVFMNKCRQCRNYGQNWGCPPFDFDTKEWLGQFRKITIVCDKIDLSGETHESVTSFFRSHRSRLLGRIDELQILHPGSSRLALAGCDECGDLGCSRPLGLPCRHPDKCFRSLESLGGDVALITKELFGFELLWPKDGKLPEYYMFVGALLY